MERNLGRARELCLAVKKKKKRSQCVCRGKGFNAKITNLEEMCYKSLAVKGKAMPG